MTDEELQEVLLQLRSFAGDLGMQWVLDEVDAAVALGVPELRTLRRTTRQGRTSYEDITVPAEELLELEENRSRRGRRSEEFIRSRPMTLQEQARLLLDALRRVLVDLDTIAMGSLEALDPRTLQAAWLLSAVAHEGAFRTGSTRVVRNRR